MERIDFINKFKTIKPDFSTKGIMKIYDFVNKHNINMNVKELTNICFEYLNDKCIEYHFKNSNNYIIPVDDMALNKNKPFVVIKL